jgi:hypothetical protein
MNLVTICNWSGKSLQKLTKSEMYCYATYSFMYNFEVYFQALKYNF